MGATNGHPVADEQVCAPGLLVEGEDYYWEGEAMVFTARYLLLRGYCCENGCRHCPYGKQSEGAP
jgi:hypothetical protein